jgi:hypothetical protein
MRIALCLCLLGVGLVPAAAPPQRADRVAELVKQLGADEFAKREAASRELEGIGVPALAALREAATTGGSLEIRRRAGQAVRTIVAGAGRKELARWKGDWKAANGDWMKFSGERWSSGSPTFGPVSGTIRVVEVGARLTLADLVVEAGPTKGGTVLAIFRRRGDALEYCGTYTSVRPTEFKTGGHYYSIVLRRVKK